MSSNREAMVKKLGSEEAYKQWQAEILEKARAKRLIHDEYTDQPISRYMKYYLRKKKRNAK